MFASTDTLPKLKSELPGLEIAPVTNLVLVRF